MKEALYQVWKNTMVGQDRNRERHGKPMSKAKADKSAVDLNAAQTADFDASNPFVVYTSEIVPFNEAMRLTTPSW